MILTFFLYFYNYTDYYLNRNYNIYFKIKNVEYLSINFTKLNKY